ncbi:hypothetical protein BGZ46_000649 [Entomortierella lignicola]|nr:hypothetical protein BGZ46_000649 [Entomortierella lignicola]
MDKKRARPTEDFSHSRKKVASELMAFDNPDGSAITTVASTAQPQDSDGSTLRRHPPVQQESTQSHLQQLTQQNHQREQQIDTPQYQQLQRGRAKSSPVEPSTVLSHERATRLTTQTNPSQGLPSPPLVLSSSTASSLDFDPRQTVPLHSNEPYCGSAAVSSTPSPNSSFSPLSPPISPLPSASSTTVDITMMDDERMAESASGSPAPSLDQGSYGYSNSSAGSTTAVESAGSSSSTSSSSSSSPSQSSSPLEAKVLNMRQRKWNSVNKEWQEWQEVQATHTPHTQSSTSYTSETRGASSCGPGITSTRSDLGAASKAASHWTGGSGNESTEMTYGINPQSSGLGRQRSFHGPGERSRPEYGGDPAHIDSRHLHGLRARSLSETCIYPYTQQHQHHQPDSYLQSHMNSQSPTLLYHMPGYQKANYSLYQAGSHQIPNDSSRHLQPSQHLQRLSGHPDRHYSDNIYSHRRESYGGNDDVSDARFAGHTLGQQNHPWTGLSMTALDGTSNIPDDRSWRGSSDTLASSHGSSSITNSVRQEDMNTPWNQQQPPRFQSGYRENLSGGSGSGSGGLQRHNYGRISPVHYGQHAQIYQHSLQHGGQEDISMGDDSVRPMMPSRSSSPVPCLSMAPTIPRPLSISFSHLTGANMLGNLAEHEHDDDMEL